MHRPGSVSCCQIFQWQRFRYSAINSRDIAKGLRNDTAHTHGLPCQQKVLERWLSTRGVPGDARDIPVEWFKDLKEGISHLSIGQRATSPAQRTDPASAGGKHELQL